MDLTEDFKALKIWVKKLTLDCPLQDPLPDCPLIPMRKMPLAERLAAVDVMSEEKLRQVIRYHHTCMGKRH